jgi:hypothetical protein
VEGQIRTQKPIRGRDRAFQSLSLRGLVAKDPGLVGWIGTGKSARVMESPECWGSPESVTKKAIILGNLIVGSS